MNWRLPRFPGAQCAITCLILHTVLACGGFTAERVLYEQQGIRIGIETDPSVSRSSSGQLNDHPASITADDLRSFLRPIQVSGWSGTLVGVFEAPPPLPLFHPDELQAIVPHLVTALQQAGQAERVFFSLPHRGESYSEDRTEGSIFTRGRYLHVVVTDHSSIVRADTGGGDPRDLRDTKGMKLWISKPAQAATVPDAEEPRWAPFERVHVSLNMKDLASFRAASGERPGPHPGMLQSVPSPLSRSPATVPEELQKQVQELTDSNLELRRRLEEQKRLMNSLTEEMTRLRLEIENTKPGTQTPRKPSSPASP